MKNISKIDDFIKNILEARRKRTGIIYIESNFEEILNYFGNVLKDVEISNVTELINKKLIIAPTRLLEIIFSSRRKCPLILLNLESVISANGNEFLDDIALFFSRAEPKPREEIFIFFYSKKYFIRFKDIYEISEFTRSNICDYNNS